MADFSQEVFDAICERLANGESLRTICASKNMPSKANVFRWIAADKTVADQYTRAREAQADSIVDDMLNIADDASIDPNDRRVRIDARKWIAGKMRPKVYGDKVAIGGADDLPPIKTEDVSAKELLRAHLDAIASRTTGAAE